MATNNNITANLTATFPVQVSTFAEVQTEVAALNKLYKEEQGITPAVSFAAKRVEQACASFTESLKAERISELLDMGTGSAMWHEFFNNRVYPTVKLSLPNTKENSYRVNSPSDCKHPRKIQISDLNAAYISKETARMEQAGEFVPNDLTIARLSKFGIEYKLLIAMVRRRFLDHNFGESETGCGYVLVGDKGKESKPQGNGFSVNAIVKQFDAAVSALLPEDFKTNAGKPVHMYKADVAELGVATNQSRNGKHGMSSDAVLEDWFAILIQKRITADTTIRATCPNADATQDTKTVSIRTTTAPKSSESTKKSAKTATVGAESGTKTSAKKTTKSTSSKSKKTASSSPESSTSEATNEPEAPKA